MLLVSKEKEKLVPMFRVKWKALPWVASAWQNSMHLELAKERSTSAVAAALMSLLNYEIPGAS